jgi:hypothetical protein
LKAIAAWQAAVKKAKQNGPLLAKPVVLIVLSPTEELKENRRPQIVQRQISHLIDDQDFRSKIDAKPAIQHTFPVSASWIGDQIVGCHEVDSLSGLDGGLRQSHGQMSLADPRRTQQNHVGRFMHETQRSQFADLSFVGRWLESKIELIECRQVRQVSQLQSEARQPRCYGTNAPKVNLLPRKQSELVGAGLGGRFFLEGI